MFTPFDQKNVSQASLLMVRYDRKALLRQDECPKTNERFLPPTHKKHVYPAQRQDHKAQDVNELDDEGADHLPETEKIFHLSTPFALFFM